MERMLTDKAKIDFEKWYFKKYCKSRKPFTKLYPHEYSEIYDWFYETLTFSFQHGVYIEWFESVGFLFDKCSVDMCYKIWTEDNWEKEPIIVDCTYIEKRKNWAKEAIQKASELYNTTHP